MDNRKLGLGLMAGVSLFLLFGSPWYLDLAYRGSDTRPLIEAGLIMGIPATVVSVMAWRFATFGAAVSALLGGGAFLLCLMGAVFGDMEERMIWSVTAAAGVFTVGALLVVRADKQRMNPAFYITTRSTLFVFLSLIVVSLLMIIFSSVFQT